MPILFEDGMDYVECELYYASIQSSFPSAYRKHQQQHQWLRKARQQQQQRIRSPSEQVQAKLKSCIRKRDASSRIPSSSSLNTSTTQLQHRLRLDRPAMRRCSFSGMPKLPNAATEESSALMPSRALLLQRSNSMEDLMDVAQNHVGFEEYVQVVTIYPAEDYPDEVRAAMWMSREEMSTSMRRAMLGGMRQQQQQGQEQEQTQYHQPYAQEVA